MCLELSARSAEDEQSRALGTEEGSQQAAACSALSRASAEMALVVRDTSRGQLARTKKRRHPVAKIKGGWSPDEDEVLIRLSTLTAATRTSCK